MHTQYSAAGQLPADQFIIALQRLDAETQEAIQRNVMRYVARSQDWRMRIEAAARQHIEEQHDMDAWIEREAALDLARHGDPVACSKTGDSAYWVNA